MEEHLHGLYFFLGFDVKNDKSIRDRFIEVMFPVFTTCLIVCTGMVVTGGQHAMLVIRAGLFGCLLALMISKIILYTLRENKSFYKLFGLSVEMMVGLFLSLLVVLFDMPEMSLFVSMCLVLYLGDDLVRMMRQLYDDTSQLFTDDHK